MLEHIVEAFEDCCCRHENAEKSKYTFRWSLVTTVARLPYLYTKAAKHLS